MLPLSATVFFASGFAALLYQVIWQRLLVLFSGADLYSVTIIVASFMGGMGVGHLAGGHVADRVPTLLMGFSFPVLQRVVQTSLPHIGRRVGMLLANVIGSMAGTALTGFLLLDRVGTAGTMRLLAVVSAAFGALAILIALRAPAVTQLRRPRSAPLAVLASAFVFVPLLMVMPPSGTLWAHLHGTVVEAMVYAEDGSGLSVVNTDGRNAILYANGIGQGSMPYGEVHTALGALPAFIHPAPRTAAVIGLVSGDTWLAGVRSRG